MTKGNGCTKKEKSNLAFFLSKTIVSRTSHILNDPIFFGNNTVLQFFYITKYVSHTQAVIFRNWNISVLV